MGIDNCKKSFEELTDSVLPRYYEKLKEAIESPLPASASMFVGPKSVTKELRSRVSRESDFSGCYVFFEKGKAVYVGISRGVLKRIVQHLNYDSHYSASLVYRMAKKASPHKMRRDEAMKDEKFREEFLLAQNRLKSMNVAFVEIENDLELYLFEVFAAMKLDTCEWNTFRTH